jgi:hypothetical protein
VLNVVGAKGPRSRTQSTSVLSPGESSAGCDPEERSTLIPPRLVETVAVPLPSPPLGWDNNDDGQVSWCWVVLTDVSGELRPSTCRCRGRPKIAAGARTIPARGDFNDGVVELVG